MFKEKFGVEIEFTGITRRRASEIVRDYLGGTIEQIGDYYDTKAIIAPDGRKWKVMYDGSIKTERVNIESGATSDKYSCELVTPILTYDEDIETLQEIVRKLRKAGAKANSSCGIHIHLNGADHSVQSIKNFINIIASKNNLLYKALDILPERAKFCRKLDSNLIQRFHNTKIKTMEQLADIWYQGYYESRDTHYHSSRYHFLNLHSFFTGNHTVELRGFNSTLHAGKVRAYIVLALAINHQALTQRTAQLSKPQVNDVNAMRSWMFQMKLNGEEFKNCRAHLMETLKEKAKLEVVTIVNSTVETYALI